ncbi:MAG TPA: haloacid dehalogenase-like hydrolase [Baekduia sp.]|nr:haloacid dehalogenase-like hydrolase [Baekduia sp.]
MLLLFDIDGTLLIDAAATHAEAMITSMESTYGVDGLHAGDIEVAGYTDPQIARHYLTLAGVPADTIDARLDDLRMAAVEAFARLCPPSLSEFLNPGITAVLDQLTSEHRISLVTGNFEPIARLKLKRAGIGHHFAAGQGGFGSDSEDRAALPPIARHRAGDWPREQTVVIGDTPHDIACAHADGVRVIAVATGPYLASELSKADVVVHHADDIPDAVASL